MKNSMEISSKHNIELLSDLVIPILEIYTKNWNKKKNHDETSVLTATVFKRLRHQRPISGWMDEWIKQRVVCTYCKSLENDTALQNQALF